MYKYILQSAGDINWMALFALITFFAVFMISAITIFGSSKKYINKMSNLPLHDSYNNKPLSKSNHEK